MKSLKFLMILGFVFSPIFLFAISNPGLNSLSGGEVFFGGKITSVDKCFCPTEEPEKIGTKLIKYDDIFWKGGTKTSGMSLFYDPLTTHLYQYKKIEEDVWNLGKYKKEEASCKYIKDSDYATAALKCLAGFCQPPKCSGKLEADGTILYMGTSK